MALASPLRVSPGAGLDFGTWPSGQTGYPPLTITLSNDNQIATPQAINIQAIVLKGDYVETDNCEVFFGFRQRLHGSDAFTQRLLV